ncbi:MAG: D-Ala-D-Ala carboxypeptidase family metallohydrolase [Pseudomonadota bacterium]
MSRATSIVRLAALVLLALAAVSTTTAGTAEASTGCLPGSIKSTLNQIRAKFGPVSIVSAHRPGARIAGSGKRSYHASCRAVDFHPPKGKYGQVLAWLRANHSGGLGTYSCGMHHIHLDNGPRVHFHKCQGASGKVYASRSSKSKRYAAKAKSSKRYAAKAAPAKANVATATAPWKTAAVAR